MGAKLNETLRAKQAAKPRNPLLSSKSRTQVLAKGRGDSFNPLVLFERFRQMRRDPATEEFLEVSGVRIPLTMVRSARARRYVLRVRPDRTARVAIPRGGSLAEGRRFAERHIPWIEQALLRLAARPAPPSEWRLGTVVLFRGEAATLQIPDPAPGDWVNLATESIRVKDVSGDLRREVEAHLWKLAAKELPARVVELAALHQLIVHRVSVRNQRSRWGSCSRRATLSLNWRILQAPVFVRDYLILHELMHLRQMNHSARFWNEVEKACPDYLAAEQWLRQHSYLLR